MNVRVFLLFVTTALFGAIWSSDQRYQETQIALARAAREREALLVATHVDQFMVELMRDIDSMRVEQVSSGLVFQFTEVRSGLDELLAAARKLKSQFEEKCCLLRWQARRTLFYAQRRAVVSFRDEQSWPDAALRLVFGKREPAPTRSAAAGNNKG